MSNPQRTCTAIVGLAESLEAHWSTYQATEAALAPALLNAAASAPGGRSSDYSDPTANRGTALTAELKVVDKRITVQSYPDTCYAVDQALKWLRLAQQRQATVRKQHPDVARQADATLRALRCDGSIDPLCTANAVKDGKCWKCIKRRQRESDGVVDMSTARVLETVAYEPRPVEPMAPNALPSGAVIAERKTWCRFCDRDVLDVDLDVHGNGRCA